MSLWLPTSFPVIKVFSFRVSHLSMVIVCPEKLGSYSKNTQEVHLYLIVCTLLLSLAVSEFWVLSWAPWFVFFFLCRMRDLMSNLILLHVDTQSFLSCLFTMLSFLRRFWKCCQKTDGCHLDCLLHWSTAWFMPMIYLLFLSPFFVYMYTFVRAFTCMWEYMTACAHLYICIWKFKLMSKIILYFS